MEEKKKKLAEARNFDTEADFEKKIAKLEGVKANQAMIERSLNEKNRRLDKRWEEMNPDKQVHKKGKKVAQAAN